jgi:hypothetical protein
MSPAFDDHSGVKPPDFQAGGIPSLVFVLSRARKYMRMQPGKLLSLFRTRTDTITRKRNPPGVSFKPFSDSLNMKRLSSDLASFHTR